MSSSITISKIDVAKKVQSKKKKKQDEESKKSSQKSEQDDLGSSGSENDEKSQNNEAKVITVNNKEYLLYERIISDSEADVIFKTQKQLQMLQQMQVSKKRGSKEVASRTSGETSYNEFLSQKQWKKDETLLLQYIILTKLY